MNGPELFVNKLKEIVLVYGHVSWVVVSNRYFSFVEDGTISVVMKDIAVMPMIKDEFQAPWRTS
jgi:hypothetical protein